MYQFGISIIADGHTYCIEHDKASRRLKMPNASISSTNMGVIQSDLCVYSFSQNTKPKREWLRTIPNDIHFTLIGSHYGCSNDIWTFYWFGYCDFAFVLLQCLKHFAFFFVSFLFKLSDSFFTLPYTFFFFFDNG